jgi:hypothetical protein
MCDDIIKMKVLHLTLYRKWFDQIAKGQKTEEYREVRPYWTTRIEGREYDEIWFRNGYRKDAPFMRVKYNGWEFGKVGGTQVYALQLGPILEIKNV